MSRQSEIEETLAEVISRSNCNVVQPRVLAKWLVSHDIGTADRFEITQTRINYVYRNEIKAKVYEVENINKNRA